MPADAWGQAVGGRRPLLRPGFRIRANDIAARSRMDALTLRARAIVKKITKKSADDCNFCGAAPVTRPSGNGR